MKAQERRRSIVHLLTASQSAVSGGLLASKYGVSRQIIVSDIAALKMAGYNISSTHSGYVLGKSQLCERIFKVWHTSEQTEDELTAITDLGGTVADVFVWHRVYGKVQASLNLFSREQVARYMEGVRTGASTELMHITGGYHYHTVCADNESVLDAVETMLDQKGYIVPEVPG